MADRTGQQFGNYRLVRPLGQGGYAEVYLGQHLRLNQQAAIKVLHAHLTESEAEHFQQEAQTISTLAHPSIIRVFDYDVQDGIPFLVMDYAPNGSLRQRYPKGSFVPLPQVVSFVKQVADALQYAHEQKFIHRDVKPENMLLGRREEVLLSDFGIATIAHSSGSLSTHEAIGTLTYMAPEQIEGHPRPASDQYALAVVVYEWLCGSRPFEGSPTEVMVQQLTLPPPPMREKVATIPSEVEQIVLRALTKDPKARFALVRDFATALEQASQHDHSPVAHIASDQFAPGSSPPANFATVVVPLEASPALAGSVTPPETPSASNTPAGQNGNPALTATTPAGPFLATTPLAEEIPLLPAPARTRQRRTIAGLPAVLIIGLIVLVVAGGVLGSLSLLAHFGSPGAHTNGAIIGPVRGGTWTIGSSLPPDSLIPFSGTSYGNFDPDQALYLPLFYSDGFGAIYPGAASEVPTVQNGGISADAKTWTFHLRPHLVWSDGQPYDARDVDFTWKLFLDPQFDPGNYLFGRSLFSSADISTDHLSITFHLKRPFAPFLPAWVDGWEAPLPAHHFSTMAPGQILKSPDLLNPQVTSGPFLMSESTPGNHFTMVRNPRYYLASRGLPYLDKVVFRILTQGAIKQGLQANTIDSTGDQSLDFTHLQDYRSLHGYMLVTSPTSVFFEGLFFNFHNTVLANHLEVRQAIAIAIGQHEVIQGFPPEEKITSQCTDHSSFYHPGFDPYAPCPVYGPATANQLLDNNGWVKGLDGVREKGGQRLEFEYSLPIIPGDPTRFDIESIVQRDLQAIGIKLDIQNYPETIFFGSFLPAGKASPPTGALSGRYDIAEYSDSLNWDPDDSFLLECDQFPPNGGNFDFYCNPALDALYQQELATVDPGARQSIFVHIHLIYLTQFPFIVLYGSKDLYMVHTGTHNFQPSPNNITDEDIAQWWCDNGKC